MWRNKKWAIVVVLAVVAVMAVGVIGGVAYAQSGSTPPPKNPRNAFMSKVAEKLGIEQSKLEEAFKQAEKELGDEALGARLKTLVEKGRITQQQADDCLKWWQSRPEVPVMPDAQPGFAPNGPMRFRGGPGRFPGPGKFAPFPDKPESVPES
jgi:hypothetical protein